MPNEPVNVLGMISDWQKAVNTSPYYQPQNNLDGEAA